MSAILDPTVADRLAKICGLFGSSHDGERAAAAAKADQLIRSCGLSWFDVITVRSANLQIEGDTVDDLIAFAIDREDLLTAWEFGFVHGISGRQLLTNKQLAKLRAIVARLRTERRAPA
jgi:hypothetical protein